MAAQANSGVQDPMLEFAKSQKRVLEINPHSPLIQGLLEEVGEVENDDEKEKTLRETVETLLDVTFVRSGFPVEDLSRCDVQLSSEPTPPSDALSRFRSSAASSAALKDFFVVRSAFRPRRRPTPRPSSPLLPSKKDPSVQPPQLTRTTTRKRSPTS